jgi:hypothetical protein
MTLVRDEARKVFTRVEKCRVCRAPIYRSLLPASGKQTFFDIDLQGSPTRTLHRTSCPNASQWRSKMRP